MSGVGLGNCTTTYDAHGPALPPPSRQENRATCLARLARALAKRPPKEQVNGYDTGMKSSS